MILKYKVKPEEIHIYNDKYVYCKILSTQKIPDTKYKIYKIKMLNHHGFHNIIVSDELQKLNLKDYIKLIKWRLL